MQYQIFVKSQSSELFTASVIGMPSIAVNGSTEGEAFTKAKAELELQLATGKIFTISVEPSTSPKTIDEISTENGSASSLKYAGIFENDPTFDDWMEKMEEIRKAANQVED